MKKSKITWAFTAFFIAVCLFSCATKQTARLPDISTAYSITIIDNWDGLSPAAPINSLFVLENPKNYIGNDYLQGYALFSVGGNWSDNKKETSQISVPIDVIQAFLQKLSQATPIPLINETYAPATEWTDDYPEITIRVLYGKSEAIEYYTTAQGDEHIPWQVTYNGESYIVNSGIPMQALEMLNDYFAQDVLQNLIKQVEKEADW